MATAFAVGHCSIHRPVAPVFSASKTVKASMAFCVACWYNDCVQYKFTDYFEKEVLRKRPYIKKEWCVRVLEKPLRVERQEGNRFRFWGVIDEIQGKVLRVVTLDDKVTIHNAFPDRRYKL